MAGSPTAIFDSKTEIGTVPTSHNGALQLAPDNKIYSAYNNYTSGHEYLGIIHNPNALGTSCNFELDGLYLEGGKAIFGLPNFIQSYFCVSQNFNYIYTCHGDTTFFFITTLLPASISATTFGSHILFFPFLFLKKFPGWV